MKDLWDQTTIDYEVMHYFIILAFIAMIMTFIFSAVINAGSHLSAYEFPLLQKYVIAFVLSNAFLSLIFFISLASFVNASYLSLISMIVILAQWALYFFLIQPVFLLFEFKKSYTKLDSLLNKSANKNDQAFYEDYKNMEDIKIMSGNDFRIKSYQIALAFVLATKKDENMTLYVNQELSFMEVARRKYNILSFVVISFLVFNLVIQIIEVILVGIEEYSKIACLIYGLIRIIINLAFLIYFPMEISCFHRLLRKQGLAMKLSSLLAILFIFNVQKPLVDIICIWCNLDDGVNYAMIVNFFILSMENLVIAILMLQGYSYKGLNFTEYKNILARFKMTMDVRITEEVPHATSFLRYGDEKDGSMMAQMEKKEDDPKTN